MIRRLVLAVFLAAAATPVVAAPTIREEIRHYDVRGANLGQLRREMVEKGPNGFWGYTRWWIEWSANCRIDLTITITLPRLVTPESLSSQDRAIWTRMTEALLAHERLHAAHGIAAAREIAANNCRNGNAIIDRWAEQDRELDRRTGHGRAQGVRLD